MDQQPAPIRPLRSVLVTALSLGCYGFALSLPAIDTLGVRGDPASTTDGLLLLLTGWLGVLGGSGGAISWLANPLVAASWLLVMFRRRTGAVAAAASAVVTCASALVLRDVIGDEAGGPASQATIAEYHSGYWLWLASMGLALVAALLVPTKPRQTQPRI